MTAVLLLLLLSLGGLYFLHWKQRHRLLVGKKFPAGIVLHHTASPPRMHGQLVDAAMIDTMHQHFTPVVDRNGKVYHIAYHYVILQDGSIQKGRPENLPGSHTRGHPDMLGIVLVGDFHQSSNRGQRGPLTPPPAQLAAAERLTMTLLAKYHLTTREVYLHRDLCQTACPGDHFPRQSFYTAIANPNHP